MTYDPNVPLSAQFISTTQPIIRNNFNKLNVDFGIDHNPYTTNVGAGEGEHKKITFTNVGSPPYPINTTKSYAYSRFIDPAPGTLTYVDYQSAGTDVISGVAPVCPMTPRAFFVATDPGGFPPVFLAIVRSFNIASVERIVVPSVGYRVIFQEKLADQNYVVLPSPTGNVSVSGIAVGRTNMSFIIETTNFYPRIDAMVF